MFAAFACRIAAGSTREPIQSGPVTAGWPAVHILSIFITHHQFLKAVDDLGPQRTAHCETFKLESNEPCVEIAFVLRRCNVDGRQKLIAHLALGARFSSALLA